MANKRETSQQKRARENRARRAALQARTGATPARPSRVAPSTAEKAAARAKAAPSGSASTSDGDSKSTSKRPVRERRVKPGDVPVDIETLEGSFYSKVTRVPGGTQVLMAAALTVMVTIMMSVLDTFIAEADVDKKDAKATQTVWEANSIGRALLILGVPLLLVGLSLAFSLHKQRRRIWLLSAVLIFVVVATQLPYYLFVAGFLGYAVYRASKVEGRAEPFFTSLRSRRQAAGADDDAVEVDGVEHDADRS